jgi:hypothetical protein
MKNNDPFINEVFTNSVGKSSSHDNTGTTVNFLNEHFRKEVNEYSDKIEIVYIQRSNTTLAIYPPISPQEIVFKIVFSCVDGKWNKSEPIYGKIISAKCESYEF